VQDFNFHTNLKSDHKLPLYSEEQINPWINFQPLGWISFAPLVTFMKHLGILSFRNL
jgi:hypothetical protein